MTRPAAHAVPLFSGQAVRVERLDHGVVHLILTRPSVRNAFDATAIGELGAALDAIGAVPETELRLVVLRGEGSVLCAGADVAYMRDQSEASRDANLDDAKLLASVFRRLAGLPVPVLGVLTGAAMGGGVGLVACCDVVIAEDSAVVALPEARLGLVPAVVGPYLIRRIGVPHVAAMAFTGRRYTAEEALRLGLVQQVVAPDDLPAALEEAVADILRGGPVAVRRTKQLFLDLVPLPPPEVETFTAATLAEVRASAEARAGIEAFLARRAAPWVPPEKRQGS
jgi:methylglutaconyl-CoA hydratase